MADLADIPRIAYDFAKQIRDTRDPSTWAADCQKYAEEFRRCLVRELGEEAQVGRFVPPTAEQPEVTGNTALTEACDGCVGCVHVLLPSREYPCNVCTGGDEYEEAPPEPEVTESEAERRYDRHLHNEPDN